MRNRTLSFPIEKKELVEQTLLSGERFSKVYAQAYRERRGAQRWNCLYGALLEGFSFAYHGCPSRSTHIDVGMATAGSGHGEDAACFTTCSKVITIWITVKPEQNRAVAAACENGGHALYMDLGGRGAAGQLSPGGVGALPYRAFR